MTRTFAASGSVWPIKALVPDSPLVNMCMSTFVLALCACVASEKQAQDNLNACVVYCKKNQRFAYYFENYNVENIAVQETNSQAWTESELISENSTGISWECPSAQEYI